MKVAITTLITLILLIIPTNAFPLEPETWISFKDVTNVDYAPKGKVIAETQFFLDMGEEVSGKIYYGDKTLSYKINVSYSFPNELIYLELGGKNVTIKKLNLLGFIIGGEKITLTYAFNDSDDTAEIVLLADANVFKSGVAIIDNDVMLNPIYRITATATAPVTLKVGTLTYETYTEGWETTVKIAKGEYVDSKTLFNYIQDLLNFAEGSYVVLSGLIYYFNLIFIDNGLLTFAMFEALVLAWAAATSRNFFTFLRKYVNTHKALFNFMLNFITMIVTIFSYIIRAIKPF